MDLLVGNRIQSADNHRGTVRFVGRVENASPEDGWVGVEWDADGRGKHDGCFQGVRYFTCPAGKGSFVRPDKFLQKSVTFQVALVNKYASEDAASAEEMMDFRSAGKKKAAVVCELVGKSKELSRMANLALLKEVTLPAALISEVGDSAWLKENARGIASLELEDNLISSWKTVFDLVIVLPNLTSLSLSGNKLEKASLSLLGTEYDGALPQLARLVLNATGSDFEQIVVLKPFLPNITDLHLACNQISLIVGVNSFVDWQNLDLLDLSDNLLIWAEVIKLAELPKLQRLILNGNRISQIELAVSSTSGTKDAAQAHVPFNTLTLLAVANNQIQDWSSVVCLRALTNLVETRLQGNLFCSDTSPAVTRQLIIATLPSVGMVNGGEVRPRERLEAEKFYIRHALARGSSSSSDAIRELAEKDSVFAALLAVHGPPDVPLSGAGQVAAGGSGASMLEITLCSMAAASSHKPSVTRRLPSSVLVGHVKKLCQQVPARSAQRAIAPYARRAPHRMCHTFFPFFPIHLTSMGSHPLAAFHEALFIKCIVPLHF
jgi:tubulin-specific chaperone E